MYRVSADSITMHPIEGLPLEQSPPWIKKSERPHISFDAEGYNTIWTHIVNGRQSVLTVANYAPYEFG
jgi:hypothetical protein